MVSLGGGWHSAHDAWYAPSAGLYALSATCDFYAYNSPAHYVQLRMLLNGATLVEQLSQISVVSSDSQAQYVSLSLPALRELAWGDVLTLSAWAETNVPVTMKACFLSAHRVVEIGPSFVMGSLCTPARRRHASKEEMLPPPVAMYVCNAWWWGGLNECSPRE